MKKRYLPSIDSLRALAVLSVIIYHINPKYLSGGFLGVDLFFVLSGYLISSLIINEYKETNDVNLYEFYLRRARRLLPAVYSMITVVLIIMVLFNAKLLSKSYLDALFGYIYSSNWWYIFHKLDYFDTFGIVSPFKHLWSLAIEEQFYMFFPLIFLIFNKYFGKKGFISKNFKILIVILLAISVITSMFLFDINNINRVYYGTDTRMFELLVGVFGAIIYPINKLSTKLPENISKIYSLTSLISIFIFIVLMIFINEYSKFLYYGGFFIISLLFLVIIISTAHQGTAISKFISFKPFVILGKLSYSLYLWHFPILVLTTPSSEIENPSFLFSILRLLLIFVVAFCSYIFIETPIRKNGFFNYFINISGKLKLATKRVRYAFYLSLSLVFLLFVMGSFGKGVPYLSSVFVSADDVKKDTEFKANNNTENINSKEQDNIEKNTYTNLIVIGDSLAVDIGHDLATQYPGTIVDAKVSRQLYQAIPIINQYNKFDNKETAILFLLGTNGFFEEHHLEEITKPIKNTDIYFVNTRVPRVWEKTVNDLLEKNKEKLNYTLIDWNSLAKNHKEYFASDQVHLKPLGKEKLLSLINSSFKKKIKTKEMIELEKQKEEMEKQKVEEEKKKQ